MSDVDIIINVATQGAKSITDLSASLRSLNKGLTALNIPLSKLDAHTTAVNKALGVGARSANDHAKSIKGLVTNQRALGSELRRIKSEINAYRVAIGFAGTKNKAFATEANAATASLKRLQSTMRGLRIRAFGSDLQSASTRLQKIGKDAQFVGRSLMINLTAPLLLFARTGFQQLLAVDKELIRLTKVLDNVAMSAEQAQRKLGGGGSDAQVKKLTNAFDKLNISLTGISSTYGVSKQLIVGLASDFAELGITGNESIVALTELTAQIEKLGAMDISGAQDLTQAMYFQSVRAYENTGAFKNVTNAIDREKMAVKAATTQMYLFNAIENATALTLKDLGQAFPEVASMAVSFGLSMTEAAAMLAPMKAAGLDVGASANSIKVSLQRALSPTSKNIKILKALAEEFGEAGDASSAFATANKTGLTGLQSIVEIFDKVKQSKGGAEGAMKLMSNLFEKRQGPRMYLAIEQMSLFNKELNSATRTANTAEGMLASVAEAAIGKFNTLNKTSLPASVNNFKDIGIIARVATGYVGQMVEGFVDASGKQKALSAADIKTAKEARKAVADRILSEKQTKGRDVVSEVKTEAGRALIVQLAGATSAQDVANAELKESLGALSVSVDRLKNNFKLFAADILKTVAPSLVKLSKKVQELMDKWNGASEEFRARVSKIIFGLVAFIAALGPVVLALGTMQAVTGVLGRAVAFFIPKLKNEAGAFIGLGNAIGGAKTKLLAFKTAQDATYLGAIRNKLLGRVAATDPNLPTSMQQITSSKFGASAKNAIVRDKKGVTFGSAEKAKVMESAKRKGFMESGAPLGRNKMQTNLLFQRSKRISDQIAAGTPLSPADYAYSLSNRRAIAGVDRGRAAGTKSIDRSVGILKRQHLIGKRSSLYDAKGIETDRLGTKFFTKRGREITEGRANQLATGSIKGRLGDAKDAAMGSVKTGATRISSQAKSIGNALNPVKQYQSAVNGAKASVASLTAQQKLFGMGAPGMFAKARAAVMGFTKGIKLANIGMKIFRMTMIASGIGALILIIGVAIYAVMKNFDKFKETAKPALDALSQAFFVIKNAAMEVIRPIFDLFSVFGKGAEGGAGAASGIGAIFAKLAGVIEFVGSVVSSFLNDIVKPVFQSITNIVMFVVSVFQGAWGNAFGYLLAALSFLGKAFINIWKFLATTTIDIITGLAKGIVSLLLKGIVNGLVQGVLLAIRGVVNLVGKIPFMKGLMDQVNNALKGAGGAVSSALSSATNGINSVIDRGGNLAKRGVSLIADNINKVLDKGTKNGIKQSTGNLMKGKKPITDAGTELGEAGGEAIANAMGDAAGEGSDKAGKAIKDGIMDMAQKLQDFVRDAFKNALEKMIDASVDAMKKQKTAALRVFDVQLKTLDKLEKAEESLTKTKEYQLNLRKILDDRDLNRANYVRNRALAIYEGRVDDARMLDVEQQQSETESVKEEGSVQEGRRKDLASENLAALREAIAEAKEKAGELFDLQIEAFQKAAADIIKIGPVTIEEYAKMHTELETLANTSSTKMNEDFGLMFEKFVTTIGDKMPNKVVGAFSTNLDLLVAEAQSKYGLGDNPEDKTIIGLTIGMLTSIGDKMGEGAPAVVAAFGAITTDLKGNFTTAKDEILVDVQKAFLEPFKKAFDEADPTAVFNKAIIDGNATILADLRNTLELNKDLYLKMAGHLDPAIIAYVKLKAAIDASNDAAAGGGGGGGGGTGGGAGFTGNVKNLTNPMGNMSVDTYLASLAADKRSISTATLIKNSAAAAKFNTATRTARKGYKEGGYISAPETQGIPALLHGGEYVINAQAVNRLGIGALNKLNDDTLPKFKEGGLVPGGARTVPDLRKIAKQKYEQKYGNNFVEKTLFAISEPKNLRKILPFLGNTAVSMAKAVNTTAGALLNVVGSFGEIGQKDKSLNPATNYFRRQEGGKKAPLNPARGLGFKDKSGMFNIADDSYLGVGEAFDVATSFPLLGAFGKAAGVAVRAGAANVILRKMGLAESGMTFKQVVTPAISAILKRNVGSTVATQITSQVAKQQFRAQEVLDQLPRQLSAPPRMLELMPGPQVQQVMPSVPALVERINGAIPLPRAGVGVELPTISLAEYILHGGPKVDQLVGGVINPDFIRGGKLWNIIKNFSKENSGQNVIGRTALGMREHSVLEASELGQNRAAMKAYRGVQNVLENANKFGGDEYAQTPLVDFSSPTGSYRNVLVPQETSFRNPYGNPSLEVAYKWSEQVQHAQNWLAQNSEIIRRIQAGEVHSTGVFPSLDKGAYEYGGIHLIRVEEALNASMRPEMSRANLKAGAPDVEIPFWGTHRPIASTFGDWSNYKQSDMSKYYTLIHEMIEDANKRMSASQMSDFAFSQKVYGNEITPGARSFILKEFNNKSWSEVANIEHIKKLLLTARTKDEMKAALSEIIRKNKKGNSLETDNYFDMFRTRMDTTIEEFANPRVLGADELRIQSHLASQIHSGTDGMMLGVGDRMPGITYGEAIKEYQGKMALENMLKDIPESLHQNFYDSMAGIPQNKNEVLRQFDSYGMTPVAELKELSDSIKINELGKNYSTPYLIPDARNKFPLNKESMTELYNNLINLSGKHSATEDIDAVLSKIPMDNFKLRDKTSQEYMQNLRYNDSLVSGYTGVDYMLMNLQHIRETGTAEQVQAYLLHMKDFRDTLNFDFSLLGGGEVNMKVDDMLNNPAMAQIVSKRIEDFKNIIAEKGIITPEDMVVYRGSGIAEGPLNSASSMDYFNSIYQVGKLTPSQFRSTSINKGVAEKTFVRAKNSIPVLEELFIPKGTNVYMPSAYGLANDVGILPTTGEGEIIIPPSYTARVDEIIQDRSLMRIIARMVKSTTAGVAGFGGVYGLSSNDKASASSLGEDERYQSYLRQLRALNDYIALNESGRVAEQYNAWHGGGKSLMMPGMSSMTINNVIAKSNKKAVGKYQQMPKYLLQRAQLAGFSGSDLYSPEVQEEIMSTMLLKKSNYSLGLIDFLNNKQSSDSAVNLLARHFRSLSGAGGVYFGGGLNPAGFDPERKDLKVKQHLEQLKEYYMPGFKAGGYVPGAPSMAIPALLHGGEFVINSNAVKNMGASALASINNSKFTTPSSSPSYTGGSKASSVSTININVDTFIGEEEWFKGMMKDYNINIVPRMQKNAGNEVRSFSSYNGLNKGM